MQDQRRRNTGPELALRKVLWASGVRYRIDSRPLAAFRRRADVVFTGVRLAVFVDGCFWHGCRWHGSWPKQNRKWWAEKIRRNRERDRETDGILRRAGWVVLRIWEHEDPARAAIRVLRKVRERMRPE